MERRTKAEMLTELAKVAHAEGMAVQVESSSGVWVKIHNPMFLHDFNFRPFKNEAIVIGRFLCRIGRLGLRD